MFPAAASAEAPLDAQAGAALARLAKALGHPARVRIVETLLRRAGCMGADLADEIGLAPSTISEHLRILKEAGLLTGEIARPRVCYALAPQAVLPLLAFLTRVAESPARALDGDCRP
ncbi:MAG: winged helix-turn-helix transcriptional regulator [Rhodoblastus sp.]|nr:MAG: winged helix-turn-helix transcriptional regulator [Rhodoblastus sp.]